MQGWIVGRSLGSWGVIFFKVTLPDSELNGVEWSIKENLVMTCYSTPIFTLARIVRKLSPAAWCPAAVRIISVLLNFPTYPPPAIDYGEGNILKKVRV